MPLQDFIHKITEGSGSRLLTVILVFFGMIGLGIWYDLAAFKNLSTIEGMDNAQLARNVAAGRGFVTGFIRPLSLHLMGKHRPSEKLLAERQPDVSNAPIYPVMLAGALKVMPFAYPDAVAERHFSIYTPDLWIAIFNQLLFALAVWMLFRLARRLLDERAGWVTAAVFAGSDLFWRFSVSGLSTIWLIILFLGLAEVLSRLEPQTRAGAARSEGWLTGMAALAGLLAGLAGLTRYSFGFVVLPVVAFIAALPTPRRPMLLMACLAAFVLVMAPWVIRNWMICGAPFGTAGFTVFENTPLFPGFDLLRSSNPDFSLVEGSDFFHKLFAGVREILEKDLPRLGGSWVPGFFLAGLLMPFRSLTLSRLRWFVVISIIVFTGVEAMARTALSTDSPEVNSENLLVVVAPLVFLFGVSFFLVLLGQFGAAISSFHNFATVLFVAMACAPLLVNLFMPQRSAVSYPPYYPPYIQEKANWVGAEDLIMSDFPWAVSWYGDRQSLWLSLKYREEVSPKYRNDFAVLNGLGKSIRGLYFSSRTLKSMDSKALTAWMRGAGSENWEEAVSDWDTFVLLGVYLKHEIPTGFPLKRAPFGLTPELFLGDSERIPAKPIKGE